MSASAQAAYYSPPTRDDLIQRGLPIVRRLAFRMARRLPPSVDVGDLIGAGSEGLLKAVEGFDAKEHSRFEPYASMRIRGAMLDELRAIDAMTRHGRRRLAQVTKAVKKLTLELGRQPEEEEVAQELGMELEDYHRLMEALARGPALAQIGDTEPDEVATAEQNPSHALDEKELKAELAQAIARLPARTQTVLALYYQEECTQAEIGQILEVTESRVCQILGEATVRLRALLGVDPPRRSPAKQRTRKKGSRREKGADSV